ncbi:hydantoinase/oxoprolinase family protein [Pseudaminobacter sp. 19-2017]|uniref:Hydantoinase/oxoprolinase family protein n=1 Tax=Pseudaminobacter soli (ex Zhang et al. 2022) TaxID=2831468 RepID=A0A942E7V6_9HYPH|nr:hydantoinase/oxoprolinase family protein [Pseudaminobacter soli]MBS3652556.1 hydantoinase/oxoprolinase family protein [Pseudaminobacter soli]
MAFPVRTALSGPAAGAVGAATSGAKSAMNDLITLYIGGTSTDVCLIHGGQTEIAHVRDIAGFRIRLPMIDIHTVGAGGGSIAHIGPDGLMKVGPESAGAVPGPACYGKGGDKPTLSDANVVLGRLPVSLAGGGLTINRQKALEAVRKIAETLGLSDVKAALGICGIAVSNMTRAIRSVSTEKGHDPRNFALMPFGGAGGLHAADVAHALGIKRIIVPFSPGILCADGLLEADLQENFVATYRTRLGGSLAEVNKIVDQLHHQAKDWIASEAKDAEQSGCMLTVDMRYVGQNYELPVKFELSDDTSAELDVEVLKEAFFEAHLRSYGHVDRDAPIEIVNVRMKGVARLRQVRATSPAPQGRAQPTEYHDVWFAESGAVSTPVYPRSALAPGFSIQGPAIVTQFDATTLVPPSTTLKVDDALNLIMEIKDAQ